MFPGLEFTLLIIHFLEKMFARFHFSAAPKYNQKLILRRRCANVFTAGHFRIRHFEDGVHLQFLKELTSAIGSSLCEFSVNIRRWCTAFEQQSDSIAKDISRQVPYVKLNYFIRADGQAVEPGPRRGQNNPVSSPRVHSGGSISTYHTAPPPPPRAAQGPSI